MDFVAIVVLQVLVAVTKLALISIGLAVIFGMMRVINLAHGEFLMLGGFTVVIATNYGVNLWVAMVVAAPIVVGLVGIVVERLVIRHLYGRMVDTMLATWGLSLLIVGAVTMIFGNNTRGVSAPLGSVAIGRYQTSVYELTLVVATVAVFLFAYVFFRFTRLGLVARATMQNARDGRIARRRYRPCLCNHFRHRRGVRPGSRAGCWHLSLVYCRRWAWPTLPRHSLRLSVAVLRYWRVPRRLARFSARSTLWPLSSRRRWWGR